MTETQHDERPKVAIIGGGVAGLFSALALSDPRLGQRFDITIYTRGWRLGGKCAAGRNPDQHDRIEEHGLHLWFGFYENALAWTRRALEDLPDDLRAEYRSFDDAFEGIDDVVLFEEWPDHESCEAVSALRLRFPGDPDRPDGRPVPSFGATVRRIADVLAASAVAMVEDGSGFGLAKLGARAVGLACRAAVRLVPRHLGEQPGARPGPVSRWRLRLLLGLLRLCRAVGWRVLRPESGRGEGRRRQIYTGIDLLTAALHGIVDERLLERGFGPIDGIELREWLQRNGARPGSIGSGSVLWALYDLVFGYHRGDSQVPELAAGKALLALLRLLGGYHGQFCYRMAASMGEVVIAPIYDLLRARGVRVAFFRDLRAVHLDGQGALASVELHRQAEVEIDGYDPFGWCQAEGHRRWPIEPVWADIGLDPQLISAEDLENGLPAQPGEQRETLRVGVDVDHVILAVPAPVLSDPALHAELIEVPAWKAMLDHSDSVATIAYQVWSDHPGSAPVNVNERYARTIVSSYDQPFSTYCPMDQLAQTERWHGGGEVRIGYGCGVWPEPSERRADLFRDDSARVADPADLSAIRAEAARSLQLLRELPQPATGGVVGSLRHRRRGAAARATKQSIVAAADRAVAPAVGPTSDALIVDDEAQNHALWVRLNDAPAHRYVMTAPGNPWFRIAADDTGVEHLSVAGDWTSNLIDGGCVEATVISALQAVRHVARRSGVAEAVLAEHLAIAGEGSWLYHGGKGGPPPTTEASAWASPARVGALSSVPGPYASNDTTLYAWLATVDPDRAAAVARRCFADMTDGAVTVEPIGSLAMLTAGDIGAVSSRSPAYRGLGQLGERQVVVWLPCHVRWATEAVTGAAPPPFAMFVPYVWVDNPMSLTTGREGLGWPKAMADFGTEVGLSLPLELSVYGLERYSPASVARPGLELLSLRRRGPAGVDGALDEAVSMAELSARLLAAAAESFGSEGLDALRAIIAALEQRGLPQLFAKSMISATDDARDDFREVVTSQATVLGWRDLHLLGPCELVVHDVASHPVAQDLGLRSQTLPVGVRMTLDFRQESGRVRWSSWASPAQRRDRRRALRPGGRRRAAR